jgi:hypothetical protein
MRKLSTILYVCLIIAGITSNSNASILLNGNFDDPVDGLTGSWGVFSTITGWETTTGPGIEVQQNTVVTAESGNQYIELDSHGYPNSNTRMEQQNIWLAEGNYFLNFYYMPRTNTTNDNGIQFGISQNNTDLFTWEVDSIRSQWETWELVSEKFSITTAANYNLYFSASGISSNGSSSSLGGFIDTVSLVPNPEPATMLLLGFGLIGIAGIARKKIRP